MNLKQQITESMQGIILDDEARTDAEVVEFYADVFVMIAEDYAKQTARYDLHTQNCECGDDSTGSLNINSCNICGYHVVDKSLKRKE